MEYNMDKIAAVPFKDMGIGKQLATALGGVLLAGTAASQIKEGIVDPARTAYQVARSSKDMMKKYPNLKQEDPDKVKDYFNVVKQFSPRAAANPLVAGALVNKMIQFGGVDHKLVQDLIQKDSTTAQRDANKAGASMAASAFGGVS
jgi:hypothetical protein